MDMQKLTLFLTGFENRMVIRYIALGGEAHGIYTMRYIFVFFSAFLLVVFPADVIRCVG